MSKAKAKSAEHVEPTIGRIVHFWPAGKPEDGAHPYAGIICGVDTEDGDTVWLRVWDCNGDASSRGPVPLFQGAEKDRPTGPHCEWPPKV